MAILYTNKRILAITPTEEYYNLLAVNKEQIGCTKEFVLQNTGYYLIDRIDLDPSEAEVKKSFRKAFEQELSESGVSRTSWPNTDKFDVFLKYFTYKVEPLIADVGKVQLKTGESYA